MGRFRYFWTSSLMVLFLISNNLIIQAQNNNDFKPSYNHLFDIVNIEGWQVYINKEGLIKQPVEMMNAMEHFKYQLYQIVRNVPMPALSIMMENVPIWIEYDTIGIAYHGRQWLIDNGFKPPDVSTMAGFCRMKTFLGGSLDQPWVVFHELAHGYDFRYLRKETKKAFQPVLDAYTAAAEDGRYQSVLCRYSDGAKHYGIGNESEYFAENSEAYFGVNDFYPFVRAQLKEFDPPAYHAIETAWGVDKKEKQERMSSFQNYLNFHEKSKSQAYVPTSRYTRSEIEGWNVMISPELNSEKAVSDTKTKLLAYKLHLIKRYMPAEVIKKMQKTTIWLEKESDYDKFVTYCDSEDELKNYGLNPDMINSVVIWNAGNFDKWEHLQTSVLLNRLAQAYYENEPEELKMEIRTAWANAGKNENFHSVLRFDGEYAMHPALTNARNYFAELSETCYGINDHYPFIRFELKKYFPDDYTVITQAYGGEPNKMKSNKK